MQVPKSTLAMDTNFLAEATELSLVKQLPARRLPKLRTQLLSQLKNYTANFVLRQLAGILCFQPLYRKSSAAYKTIC